MKNSRAYYWIFLLLLGSFPLFAERQNIHISREDGTVIEGYFDRPDGKTDVPVVVLVNGSEEVSVVINHEKLAERFLPRKIGLISIEKRGITPKQIDKGEFLAHDCFEERLSDYSLLMKQLEERKISGCNGRVILLGGSEGGKIVPRLSLAFPSMVRGVVLIGSGGGLPFAQEMKYQSQKLIQQMGSLKRLSYKMRGSLFPKEIDQLYGKMLESPESLEMCGPKTYKWFASYLRYDPLPDLLNVEAPIYMIHGKEDIMVPIQSADLVKKTFDQAGKTNLHYARYKDLGHALTGREDVYAPMMEWICEKSFSSSVQIIATDDAKLFCQTLGEGKPLIVLHGGPGLTHEYLLPQMTELAQNHRLIFYDQRGCGRSTGEMIPETITIERFVEDLDAVRQAFHLGKVSILGHSWGGFLAMEYAIAHPESVDKLILASSMPASSEELALFIQEWSRRMAPFMEEFEGIRNSSAFRKGDPDTMERYHRMMFRTYCHLPEKAEQINLRIPAQMSVDGGKVYELMNQNVFQKSFNLHDGLKKLHVPTLVLHGDADPIPPSTAHKIHESIRGSKYVLMKNCGHFPYVEDPDAFFEHVNEFLSGN